MRDLADADLLIQELHSLSIAFLHAELGSEAEVRGKRGCLVLCQDVSC